MPSAQVTPNMTVRVPENIQNLMRARAAQLNMKPGAYLAQLIINDSPELRHLFVSETDDEREENEDETR